MIRRILRGVLTVLDRWRAPSEEAEIEAEIRARYEAKYASLYRGRYTAEQAEKIRGAAVRLVTAKLDRHGLPRPTDAHGRFQRGWGMGPNPLPETPAGRRGGINGTYN